MLHCEGSNIFTLKSYYSLQSFPLDHVISQVHTHLHLMLVTLSLHGRGLHTYTLTPAQACAWIIFLLLVGSGNYQSLQSMIVLAIFIFGSERRWNY